MISSNSKESTCGVGRALYSNALLPRWRSPSSISNQRCPASSQYAMTGFTGHAIAPTSGRGHASFVADDAVGVSGAAALGTACNCVMVRLFGLAFQHVRHLI